MSNEIKHEIVKYKEEKNLENQVDEKALELSKQISKAENKEELDILYNAFRVNDTKKNIFRINKLNNLLDKVTEEATNRFENRSGEMSNKEVIDYMNAISNQIDKSKSIVDNIKEINSVNINNTLNVNIQNENNKLNRESREKVINFIRNILEDKPNDKNEDENIIETIISEKEE